MQNKILLVLIFSIIVLCPQIALGDEIIVEGADAVWDLTLDGATEAPTALGNEAVAEEAITAYNLTVDNAISNAPIMPGDEIIVVDADTVWNLTLDNATHIGRLVGEPGVIVTKYADTFSYYLLERAGRYSHKICGYVLILPFRECYRGSSSHWRTRGDGH